MYVNQSRPPRHGKENQRSERSGDIPHAPLPAHLRRAANPHPMSHLSLFRHRHNRHLSTETSRDRHPRSFRTTKPPIPSRRPVALDVPDALTEDREPVTTSGNFSSTSRPEYIELPIPSLSTPYPASRTPTTTHLTTPHPPCNTPPSSYPCPSRHLLPLPPWKASSRSPPRGRRRTAGSASQWHANTAGTGEQAPSSA